MSQKIVPHLWFDREAIEAVEFYTSIFPDSLILSRYKLHNTPSGDCDLLRFQLMGFEFMAISAGPLFKINPSISFTIRCQNIGMVDALWEKLSPLGQALMPLDRYFFSERYGWIQDRYGVSWQLIFTREVDRGRHVLPSLLFTKEKSGKAKEAIDFYLSVFRNARMGTLMLYPEDTPYGQKKGDVMFAEFFLENILFTAMDGGLTHDFSFNEAISFIVFCENQGEIDHYFEKLSNDPNAEQCGWLKDRFGISWQILPKNMDDLMTQNPDRVMQTLLSMKKINIEELKRASEKI
jgi:predicted 3-demethylubiquinone-9 3-methyltransferase (glyoxalase superfamily)